MSRTLEQMWRGSPPAPEGRTRLQIASDISSEAQERPEVTVKASDGDAFLAGVTAGVLRREDLARWVRPADTVRPDPALKSGDERLYRLYRDLYEQTRGTVHAPGPAES